VTYSVTKTDTMKKTLFLSLLFFSLALHAQDTIEGTWLMTRVENNEKADEPYIVTHFKPDGKMYFRDFEIATWKASGKQLVFDSKYDPKFSGKANVLKLDDKELIYQKGDDKYYYVRYDEKIISAHPVYRQLLGAWKLSGTQTSIYYFGKDNSMAELTLFTDGSMTTKGDWFYLPAENNLVIQADVANFKGTNRILQINQDILELEYKGIKYTLEKMPSVESPSDKLNFTYEDIEANESEVQDLPWSDEALFGFLSSVKELYYARKTFEKDVKTYSTEDWQFDVQVDPDEKEIKFTGYRVQNGKKIKESEMNKAFLENTYNRFFPQEEIAPFRILNNFEKITINDKVYACTVVEGFNGDDKIKYWMINDMPGVFAKIIRQNDDNDYYVVYQWKGL